MAENKKRDSFLIQGTVLAAAAILVRIIGLLYRIPMVNIIGKEGMAYYNGAFQIYNVVLLVSSYSMPSAMSRLVSERITKRQFRNVDRLMTVAFLSALFVGAAAAACLFFGAGFFANQVLRLPLAEIAIKTLAPCVFIMAFLGVLRGFFQGMRTMIPTAFSQIFEQIVNAIVSVSAAWILFGVGRRTDLVKGTHLYANAFGAAGGTIGTAMGALAAFVFVLFVYLAYHKLFAAAVRKDTRHREESYSRLLQLLVITAVPIILSTAVYNLNDLIDNAMFGHYITGTENASQYETIWGTYSGMYMTIIYVPISFSSALSASTMPSITAAHTNGDWNEIVKKVNLAVKMTMLIVIPSAIGLAVISKPLMALLFSGSGDTSDAAHYLVLGCPTVIFMSLSTLTNGILQGLGRLRTPAFHAAISLAVHVVLMAILLWGFHLGIEGVIIAYILFAVCMSILNGYSISVQEGIGQDWMRNYVLPFVCAAVMGVVTWGVKLLVSGMHRNWITVPVCILAAVLVYAVCILLTGTVSREELKEFPMGVRLIRLADRFHLLRS